MMMILDWRFLGLATFSAAALCNAGCAIAESPPVGGPPPGYEMAMTFNDEFNGTALDTRRWINVFADPLPPQWTIAKRALWGNGDLQVYFDKTYLGLGLDPFKITGGTLTISAAPMTPTVREAVMADLARQPPNIRNSALKNVRYSSGMLSTRGLWHQRQGYFEMRARWSGGKGLWPAFWLLPRGGGWPPEIDVLEAHGDKPGTAYHSIHSSVTPKDTTKAIAYPGDPQAFHTYGAMWLRNKVDYYIDGRLTASIPTNSDMTEPMYLLVTFAIGGYWPGNPTAATAMPATLEIDYVRAWKVNPKK